VDLPRRQKKWRAAGGKAPDLLLCKWCKVNHLEIEAGKKGRGFEEPRMLADNISFGPG
jgi:hypothetical protein